uniref:Protein ENHANCED DISEASE RESISTANCE 2-like n=1 Tax=Noccaea caerulescens TaxID=107243 RepID=A0A1J3FXF6_NOCCA
MLGYITSLTVDIGFVVEAQTEDELPERLIGAYRISHPELSSAFVIDSQKTLQPRRMISSAKENDDDGDEKV